MPTVQFLILLCLSVIHLLHLLVLSLSLSIHRHKPQQQDGWALILCLIVTSICIQIPQFVQITADPATWPSTKPHPLPRYTTAAAAAGTIYDVGVGWCVYASLSPTPSSPFKYDTLDAANGHSPSVYLFGSCCCWLWRKLLLRAEHPSVRPSIRPRAT